MNLNEEFSKIINNLERIRKMAESLYNEPLPFNQRVNRLLSDMYELEREINILLYFRDKYLEDKKK